MAIDINLTGHLTDAVKKSLSARGASYAVFSVASNRRARRADGGKTVDFVRCVAYASEMEYLAKYSKKGDLVKITGELNINTYTNTDGQKIVSPSVIVEHSEILSHARNDGNAQESTPDENYEIPF